MRARKVPIRQPQLRDVENSSHVKVPRQHLTSLRSPLKFRPRDLLFLQIIASSISDVPFFDLPEKYGVQDLAPRGRRGPDEGVPFLLGSGTSCHVVQHETGEDTSKVLPAGSLVALKIYRQQGVDYSTPSASASKDLAQVNWQDLRVFCHPYLRNHENFCRLLFIAWEPFSLVPVLALELAAFGSLQDALQSESDLSLTQRANISMDIALGLAMLHDCGFIHGDIKPSNVMLQAHSERQVLAKILDFSGATDMSHYGTSGHKSYMTKLWLAPEVLLGSRRVDWERVDTYAYGLVLAHLWSYEDLDLMEIFLESAVPPHSSISEKQDFLLFYKCCADEEYMSAVRQALRIVLDPSIDDDDDRNEKLPLEDLIEGTLARDPGKRRPMSQLIPLFRNFALTANRELPTVVSREEAQDAEMLKWESASDRNFFTLSKSFTGRSEEHQRLTLQHMRVVSKKPLLDSTPFITGSDSDFKDPSALWALILRNDGALDAVDNDEYYCRVLHYQIAGCLLTGQGSKVDEDTALEYLGSAALGGIKRAMYMLQQVESSVGKQLPSDIPRKLFLVLGHLNGCTEASDILGATDPETFVTAECLSWTIRWTDLAVDCPSFLRVVYTPGSDALSDEGSSLSKDIRSRKGDTELFDAVESGQVNRMKALLSQGFDPNALNQSGMSSLHCLALIADEDGAQMVEPLILAGAKSDLEKLESFAFWKNRAYNGRGTPLIWAIVKNKPLLFEKLLRVGSAAQASDYKYSATAFVLMVALRRFQMLEMIMKFPNDIRDVLEGPLSLVIFNDTLTYAIENYADGDSMGRRWSLGEDFNTGREAVVNFLLKMGADPLCKPRGSKRTPLAHAIFQGDGVCVKAFVDHLRSRGSDVDRLMSRDGVLGGNHFWSALRGSLNAGCRAAFLYILEEFPSTIDELSSHGLSPLSHAASEGNSFAVDRLLTYGATFKPSKQGSSPFVDALCNGSIEVAATILNHIGKEKLIGANPQSNGHTAFSLVLHTFTAGRRHIGLQSFKFLHEVGGLCFVTNEITNETAFQVFLKNGRPSYYLHRSAECDLLRYFLRNEIFLAHIDQLSGTGLGAIHYAAIHVYTEAAEILIECGANVNLETGPATSAKAKAKETERRSSRGRWTALDFAVNSYIHGAPADIKIGGATELREWKLRLDGLIRLLADRGGKNGSEAPASYSIHVQKILNPSKMKSIHLSYANNPNPGEEIWRGSWPKPIPRCPHVLRLPNPEEGESVENGDEGTILQQQNRPIIYRTRKGKKIKTTDLILSLLGPVLESDSEEETEASRRDKEKQLKHARAVIEVQMMAEESGVNG